MNPCEPILAALDDFRDGVLDDKHKLEVQVHLNQCDDCQKYMAQSASIEKAVKDEALNWVPSEELWARIQGSAGRRESRQNSASKYSSFRFGWMVGALALLTISLVSFSLIRQDGQASVNPVASALVNEFHTFVISRRDLDYVDTRPESVREWFGNKVDFRAPNPVKTATLKLAGGRLCNMLNQRIASYMYHVDGNWVSLYIMKPEHSSVSPGVAGEIVVQGYGYIDWKHDGLHYSLVGDIGVERLRQFASELQST